MSEFVEKVSGVEEVGVIDPVPGNGSVNIKLKFKKKDREEPIIVTKDSFEEVMASKNWTVVEEQDFTQRVYEEKRKVICSECEVSPLFDDKRNEYYCPRCDS